MAKNSVCHLTSVHPYNDTRIFHKECVSLVSAGYDVRLVAPVKKAFVEKGVEIVAVGEWSSRYHRLFVIIPRLLVKALQSNAAVYHFHDPELLLIAPLLRLSGAKVIYDIHEDYVTSIQQKTYLPRLLRTLVATLFGSLEKIAAGLCYQVIAEKYYRERFPAAVEILNYPIFCDVNGAADNDYRLLPEAGESFDHRYAWFLYTGNVTRDRGALLQLELLNTHAKTAIAFIGKCPEDLADEIESFLDKQRISRERVKIIGRGRYLSRETIDYYTYSHNWIAGVALFPKTPHYINKELTKFFEYMAAGLPVLCSDFPVWKNIVEQNGCGIAVDIESPSALAKAIESMLSHRESVVSMGERGRRAVREKYNWGVEEKKLIGLYASLAD